MSVGSISAEVRPSARSSPLRVYLVITQFLPVIGGAERQALAQARALRERGCESTIVTIRHDRHWPRHEVLDGVPVIRVAGWIAANRDRFPAPVRKLAFFVAVLILGVVLWWHRRRYDVVSIYQLNVLTVVAALSAFLGRRPIVISPRCASPPPAGPNGPLSGAPTAAADVVDADALDRLGRPFVFATRALLKRAGAAMVVLSKQMEREMRNRGFDLRTIECIPNGVDITRFRPVTDQTEPCRDRTVICVARLSYQKGIDTLLSAWRVVVDHVPDARLLIVGTGPLEDELRQMATTLGLGSSIEFLGMQQDVPAWIRRAGTAVLSSRFEGMPNALLEAMASGLACVSTRVSGAEDLIVDGYSGLLVDPEDSEGLSRALIRVLGDGQLRARLGRNARSTIVSTYAVERVTERHLDLYRRLATADR